jgi:hypothetical protein
VNQEIDKRAGREPLNIPFKYEIPKFDLPISIDKVIDVNKIAEGIKELDPLLKNLTSQQLLTLQKALEGL